MLGQRIHRHPRLRPAHGHDHLFTDIAPGGAGASARLLALLYEQYADNIESAPAQYLHFRRLVKTIVGEDDPRRLRAIAGDVLQRVRAAYVCCFEPSAPYQRQLAAFWAHPAFLTQMLRARAALITDLQAHAEAARARQAQLARLHDCLAAPLDIEGDTLLALIRQMQPDDWHEMVLRWNWDHGITELEWITAHPACDRATALAAYCAGGPGRIATRWQKPAYETGRWDYGGFVRAVAARLENGFYMNAALGLGVPTPTLETYATEMAAARATRESPWQISNDALTHPGRAHAPKYTLHNGEAHFHYEYWRAHLAKR
jgi:hypothetical protein